MLLGIELGQVLKSVNVTTRPRRESTSTTCWLGLQKRNVGRTLLVLRRFDHQTLRWSHLPPAAASAARFLQDDMLNLNYGRSRGLAQLRARSFGMRSDSTMINDELERVKVRAVRRARRKNAREML